MLPLVYAELRKLAGVRMCTESPGHTLDATALVHEAYMRLVGDQLLEELGHFFAAAEAIRRILIDQARARKAIKRGGGMGRVDQDPDRLAMATPDEELLAIDEALETLSRTKPDHTKLLELRYFAGLTGDEAAAALGVAPATANRMSRFAKAWLQVELGSSP